MFVSHEVVHLTDLFRSPFPSLIEGVQPGTLVWDNIARGIPIGALMLRKERGKFIGVIDGRKRLAGVVTGATTASITMEDETEWPVSALLDTLEFLRMQAKHPACKDEAQVAANAISRFQVPIIAVSCTDEEADLLRVQSNSSFPEG